MNVPTETRTISHGASPTTTSDAETSPADLEATAPWPGEESERYLPGIGDPLRHRRFAVALVAISGSALALRVVYVLTVTRYQNGKLYDSFWYYSTTIGLRSGQFFRAPFSFSPSAAHPPMTSLLLAAGAYVVGLHGGTTSSLLVMAVLGTGVVLCVGLVGRAVAGPWVGLTAAGLAAVAPNFWMPSGILMSETPAMLFMALILLAVVRLVRRPTAAAALLLGLACGAEALVRAELILFVPGLLLPATLVAPGLSRRRRLLLLGIGLGAVLLVLGPWFGRNLATFEDPTYISTGNGLVLSGANCAQTYNGPELGLWSVASRERPRGAGTSPSRRHATNRSGCNTWSTMPVTSPPSSGCGWLACGISIARLRWRKWRPAKDVPMRPLWPASRGTTPCCLLPRAASSSSAAAISTSGFSSCQLQW